jgi:hypothetical protein
MQTTDNLNCVFFNYLVCSDLVDGTTYPVLLVLVPLFLLIIGVYWNYNRSLEEADLETHRAEAARLRALMHHVKDYSFRRTPLICSTTYQVTYYNNVLKNYNNVGRCVELVEMNKSQDNHQHAASKVQLSKHYCSLHSDMIKEGERNANHYWDELIREGLLDYLQTPKGPNWEKSKEYIEEVTAYLVLNDRPRPSDQAKKKLVLDVMPSNRIG